MPLHNTLIHALKGPSEPLPLDRLAHYWVRQNLSAIAAIALKSMMDPVGTAYSLPPFRIVGFQTGEARILYQLRLHQAANRQTAKPIVEHAIAQHIGELAEFCRVEFLTELSILEVGRTFKRDQFAYLRTGSQ